MRLVAFSPFLCYAFNDMSCGQALKGMGYRLTPQRMMVVEALHDAEKHVSAEEIYAQVRARYPYANISTVYRTLELLKELGLVTEIALGDGCVRFHPAEKGHHHHLVCQKCGKVIDLPESALDSLEKILRDDYQFKADLKHMAVFGLCSECQNMA
jgi:Fur family ferric uptake transcriptional regulator